MMFALLAKPKGDHFNCASSLSRKRGASIWKRRDVAMVSFQFWRKRLLADLKRVQKFTVGYF